MRTLILADFDNFKPHSLENRNGLENSIEKIKAAIKKIAHHLKNDIIHIRIYGGWLDEMGRNTRRAEMLYPSLSLLRTRIERKGATVELALGILNSNENIHALYHSGQNKQKMVDALMSVDMTKQSEFDEVVIFSKDTDLIPAALEASLSKRVLVVTSPCAAVTANLGILNSKRVIILKTSGGAYDELERING